MSTASGNGDDITQTGGNICLARTTTSAPGCHGAISPQAEGVTATCRYGNHVVQTRRHIGSWV
jgi:hypothetical protein